MYSGQVATGIPGQVEDPTALDPTSLILQVISELCAQGIPPDKAAYFQKKIYPLMIRMVKYVMSRTPDKPQVALMLWLMAASNVPAELAALMRDWAEGRWTFDEAAEKTEALRRGYADDLAAQRKSVSSSVQSDEGKRRGSAVKEIKSCMKKRSSLKDDEDEMPDSLQEAHAAVMQKTAERTTKKRNTAYITPAGTHLTREDARARGEINLTDSQKLQVIKDVSFFENLDPKDLKVMAKAFNVSSYLEGEEVTKFGQSGDGLHIVLHGEGKVSVSHEIGSVKTGDLIGHNDLIQGCPASETIEAYNGALVTLQLPPLIFRSLGLKKKLGAMNRKKAAKRRDDTKIADAPGEITKVCALHGSGPKEHPVLEEDQHLIADALIKNRNLNEVLNLSDKQVKLLLEVVYRIYIPKGTEVFKRGDYGDAFFIIQDGVFEVGGTCLGIPGDTSSNVKLRAGDSFGELALLYDCPRSATVTCTKEGSVWTITRTTFRNVMRLKKEGRIEEYLQLVETVDTFKSRIRPEERAALCDAFEEMYFVRGERIVQQGEGAEFFFILFEGKCGVYIDDVFQAELGRGSCFGEKALLHDDVRQATVQVTSETCTVLALDKIAFDVFLYDPMEEDEQGIAHVDSTEQCAVTQEKNLGLKLKERLKKKSGGKKKKEQTDADKSEMQGPAAIQRENLEKIGYLGKGSFGFVSLERERTSGKLFALKAMSKGHIMQERLKDMVINEKACMEILDSDFIVRLWGTYKDDQHIYLLLEPCFGGELFDVYNDHHDMFGSEDHAKFYAASVALAFEHMHERRIIYRDLKLENCLLTSNGFMKLTDMGLAKVVIGKTYTVCGTTDYFAPETLRQTGHNRAVDWWALAVMIYIMMSGRSPFDAPDAMKTYKKIIKGFTKVIFPPECSDTCVSIIHGLGQKKPEERLTMGNLGVQNFKDHPWYRGFQWQGLSAQITHPPFNPGINEEKIVAKAAANANDTPPAVIHYEDDGSGWDEAFAHVSRTR